MPEVVDVGIDGVSLFLPPVHQDNRGSVTEVFRQEWLAPGAQMLQANLSRSRIDQDLLVHRPKTSNGVVVATLT